MEELQEKIGYLRGLLEATQRDEAETKLANAMMDVLDVLSRGVGEMREELSELNDYVESIDEDLNELEAMHDEEGPMDFLPEEEEEFEDGDYEPEDGLHVLRGDGHHDAEAFIGALCPECGRMFFVRAEEDEQSEEGDRFLCPHCQKEVPLEPLNPENTPIAKKVPPQK